ncbi:MAG TPA: AI-2E family transporter, partial [Pirellulales bacterium]
MPVTVEPPIRSELHVQTICLSVLTVVAVGFALWWLQPVMIPFVIAAFLAFALMPLVDRLEIYIHLPRTVAVCMALLLALLALVGMGVLTRTAVVQITDNAGQYQQQLGSMLDSIADSPPLHWLSKHLPGSVRGISPKPPSSQTPDESNTDAKSTTNPGAKSAANSGVKSETDAGAKPGIAIPPPKKEPDGAAKSRETARSQATSTEDADENSQTSRTSPWSLIPNSAIQTFLINASKAALGIVQQSVIVLIFMFFLLMS